MASCMSAIEVLSDSTFWTYAEFEHRLYKVSWSGDCSCPDLHNFPTVTGARIQLVNISEEMRDLLGRSTAIDYGADAWIRSMGEDVVKFAYPTPDARARIGHEYEMLQHMSKLSLPVPHVKGEPFADADGVFAFRMERLHPWKVADAHVTSSEMRRLMKLLHSYNIVYRDWSDANIMQKENGDTIIIDFGYAGFHNQPIPDFQKPSAPDSDPQLFDFELDHARLRSLWAFGTPSHEV